MTMKNETKLDSVKDYTIGLDIGTNSVGWAVMNDDYTIPRKRMKISGNTDVKYLKKNFWGVRLFDSAKTAENRRLYRTTGRRLERRANRISYLQEIFSSEIEKIDKNFFGRMMESFYQIEDRSIKEKHPLFPTLNEESQYYKDYPTIYHLRKSLVDGERNLFGFDKDGKADLRLVYLAIHHAIKYRGHFLIEGKFNPENSNVASAFKEFLNEYNELFSLQPDGSYINAVDESTDVEAYLTEKISRARKVENVLSLFPTQKKNGEFHNFLKLIIGNQANFKMLLENPEDAKLQLTKDTYEEDLENLISLIGDEYLDIFNSAQKAFDSIELSNILSTENSDSEALISSSMVERYIEHSKDLADFKKFIKENLPEQYFEVFRDESKQGYAGYINGGVKEPDFYSFIKKNIEKFDNADKFIKKIDNETFLRKQRTYDNGVIPHQLHKAEVEKIIEKQGKFYPFLLENKDKTLQILEFRIPYYVGPLGKNNNSDFSWIERKSGDPVRPWNFKEIVDEATSATRFIEKMTNFDTYLPKEKVLPKHSLLYEKYTVFNELTKVKFIASGFSEPQWLDTKQKKVIFNTLFKNSKKVSSKQLIKCIEDEFKYADVSIESGIDKNFNASFSTYIDLANNGISRNILDNEDYEEMLEDIVKILTVFEDRKMIKQQLNKYADVIGETTVNKLSRKHYTGWGRLSRRLIDGIYDKDTQKTILDFLEDDSAHRNFMQLINDDKLSFKKEITDQQLKNDFSSFKNTVDSLAGSPAIKKGILQSLYIVEELVRVMGRKPKNIVIEMAREDQTTDQGTRLSKTCEKKIKDGLKELGKDAEKINPNYTDYRNDKIYLYYMQNGKDIYTGEDLDIHNLSNYDIDHIIPQSFITDNSIDNRVLTSSRSNRGKSDNLPSEDVIKKMSIEWYRLNKAGLLSDRKLANLTKGSLSQQDKEIFINRQLVETRQITKNVAAILYSYFNLNENNEKVDESEAVNIITLKSALTSQFRKQFGIYKIRELNDMHHAHDAYLNSVVGTTILKVYPNLRSNFVYGEFKKSSYKGPDKATYRKKLNSNLMLFFSSNEPIINDDGEILWNGSTDIPTIKKVMGSHQMNVTKKLETRAANEEGRELFKQTIDKTKSNGGGKGANNIKTKAKRADGSTFALKIDKYGGYLEQKEAFITIKKDKLISVKRTEVNQFKDGIQIKRNQIFMQKDGYLRTISSLKESAKWNQLVLEEKYIEYIYKLKNISSYELGKDYRDYLEENEYLFDEIIEKIVDFIEKNQLAKTKDINIPENLSIEYKRDIILALLNIASRGTTSEHTIIDENNKKIIINKRIRYNTAADRLKIGESVLIHKSITGLYESRRSLGKKED